MSSLDKREIKYKNQTIFFDYLSNRYIKVKSDMYIYNFHIKNSIESIGSHRKYSELGLRGSQLHIGIKKIRHHCREHHSVNLSGREIKYLMNTRKKIYNSDNVVCCTYNVYIILKSIVEILTEVPLSKYFDFLPESYYRIKNQQIIAEEMESVTNQIHRNRIRIREVISQLAQHIN